MSGSWRLWNSLVLIVMVEACALEALGVSLGKHSNAVASSAPVDPPNQQLESVWLNPSSATRHVVDYLMSTGRLTEITKAAFSPPAIRLDRPILLQGGRANLDYAAVALSVTGDPSIPARFGICYKGADGFRLCTHSNQRFSDFEGTYRKKVPAHDLELIDPNVMHALFGKVTNFRDDVPGTTQKLLEQFPSVTGKQPVTTLFESWFYEVQHRFLQWGTNLGAATLTLDITPEGGLQGEGSVASEMPPELAAAMTSIGRHPATLTAAFPPRSDIVLSTDARLLGVFAVPSTRTQGFATQLLGALGKDDIDLLARLTTVHENCLSRPGEVVIGNGRLRDFEDEKNATKQTGKNSNDDYVALGIRDADDRCWRATTALLALHPTKPKDASGPTKVAELAFRRGVLRVTSIGKVVWFAYAAESPTAAAAMKGLAARLAGHKPSRNEVPSALLVRKRFIPEGPISRDWATAGRDVPQLFTRVDLDAKRLKLSTWTSKGAVDPLLIQLIFAAAGSEHELHVAEAMDSACALGSGNACNGAGVGYLEWPGATNPAAAERVLAQGCRYNHGMSCLNWGFALSKERPLEARKAYLRSCELETALGCALAGQVLLESENTEDQKQAFGKLQMACDNDVPSSCTNLGYQYQEGRGVALDGQKAATYYERGCNRNHGLGCVLLGHMYASGKHRPLETTKALSLYEKACETGEKFGCHFAGMLLLFAEGLERNPEAGRKYLGKACDAGYAESCRQLAELKGGHK